MNPALQLLVEWLDREKQDFPVHRPGTCVDPATCLTCRTAVYIDDATEPHTQHSIDCLAFAKSNGADPNCLACRENVLRGTNAQPVRQNG